MRIFVNRWFQRFAAREGIGDKSLLDAVHRAERGLLDADLGGGVIKQRIARSGEGRSGGFRTIILFRLGDHAFFVFGFAKSDRENISKDELKGFRELAKEMRRFDEGQLLKALDSESLWELKDYEQDI